MKERCVVFGFRGGESWWAVTEKVRERGEWVKSEWVESGIGGKREDWLVLPWGEGWGRLEEKREDESEMLLLLLVG
jgi:hypothetical protein